MNTFSKVIACAALVLAGTLHAELGKEYDIRPDANVKNGPTAVDWQAKNDKALAAETTPEKLAACVATPEAAAALLAQVKTAYATDALVATKIAAVSQYVLTLPTEEAPWYAFWSCPRPAEGRIIWAKALMTAASESTDFYRTMFFLEQLRYAGTPCQKACLEKLAETTQWEAVKQFIPVVIGK